MAPAIKEKAEKRRFIIVIHIDMNKPDVSNIFEHFNTQQISNTFEDFKSRHVNTFNELKEVKVS